MSDDPMEAIREAFFEECRELLDQLEEGLLALQDGTHDQETIGAVFRAVHSIKGGAGAFGLKALTDFSHAFENTLDLIRSGRVVPDQDTVMALLRASDVLADIARATADGEEPAADTADAVLAELASIQGGGAEEPAVGAAQDHGVQQTGFEPAPLVLDDDAAAEDDEDIAYSAMPLALDDLDGGEEDAGAVDAEDGTKDGFPEGAMSKTAAWDIHFEPLPGLLESGNEPLYFFRALAVLGKVETYCDDEGLPHLEELDPAEIMLRWRVRLSASSPDLTRTEIENVFDFADGLCDLKVHPAAPEPAASTPKASARPSSPPAPQPKGGKPANASKPKPAPAATASAGTGAGVTPPPRPVPVRKPNTSDMRGRPQQSSSVRVDLQRVDDLVNLVGEIVIAQAMLSQIVSEPDRHAEIAGCLDGLSQLTLEVQDSVMAIRALPIKPLFQRMSRIVREASQMTGKDVRLVTKGEETQIDKTVIELLADPLTHMIRNAVDHGIEDADDRRTAGKEKQGTVTLSAAQRSDRVFVEIEDDGAGIDRARVLAKARKQGLVDADAHLDPGDIDRLLFLPGFSTSENVSELSGRGVGMDVVNRAIQDLSGSISIQSDPGKGTKLTVSLPLTLAILDGMVVSSHGERYVMPLASIVETQTLEGSKIERMADGGQVVMMQERYVPFHDLGRLLGRGESTADEDDRTILLVEPGDAAPFALLVDGIEAQRQVVVKGLGDSVGRIPGISAATILGDGQVALILDGMGLQGLARRPHAVAQLERLAS